MEKTLASIEFKSSSGQSTSLSQYSGKVLLIVNVASKCGLTPQYDGLEKIYEKYKDQGLVVLGFPANEFGAQEPGSNAEIQDFCRTSFGVKFPVNEKIVVKGPGQHPLYAELTHLMPKATGKTNSEFEALLDSHKLLTGGPEEIKWNFEKFVIDRKGKVVARFAPDITPEDPQVISLLEKELAN